MRGIISKLIGISEKSYYVWKKKTHKDLISLLEKYFTNEDLEEFLETGEIRKFKDREVSLTLEERVEKIEEEISWFKFKELWSWLYAAHGEVVNWALANYRTLSKEQFYNELTKMVQGKNITWKGKDITAYFGIIFYNLHKDDI
jgi:hypothetical protein